MLVIEPTADGRLRIQNNHRTEFARDETAARTLAYNWGHTAVSINKALSEMRASARGEAEPSGWRATPNAAPAALPQALPAAPAAAVRNGRGPKRVQQPTRASKAAPTVSPAQAEPKPPTKTPSRTAPRPQRESGPRERALSHFRAGVKELVEVESSTLAFARGPWSDLREMAEYITTCLEGKRPKTGWAREGK
ncbi:MAG: hypothetical protein KY464_02260 [Gemmatimonadetes bacterium]|nr:hypothetical protein [Gemmatimonadota bacterium]